MKTLSFTDEQLNIIKSIIIFDIANLTNENRAFFEELEHENISIIEYINQRIAIAEKFDVDFWKTVKQQGNHFTFNRLMALYSGETLESYYNNYEKPSETELVKDFFIDILDQKKKKE